MRQPLARVRAAPARPRPRRRDPGAAAGAAVELLEEGGYAAASVAAIAARSGVAAGALYRHFPSKAALFVEVFRTVAERRAGRALRGERGAGTVVEKLDAVVREFTGSALGKPRLAWALGYEPVDPLVDAERLAYRQTYRERLAELLRKGSPAASCPRRTPS